MYSTYYLFMYGMFPMSAVTFLVFTFFAKFSCFLAPFTMLMFLVISTVFLMFLLLAVFFIIVFAVMLLIVMSFLSLLVLMPDFIPLRTGINRKSLLKLYCQNIIFTDKNIVVAIIHSKFVGVKFHSKE